MKTIALLLASISTPLLGSAQIGLAAPHARYQTNRAVAPRQMPRLARLEGKGLVVPLPVAVHRRGLEVGWKYGCTGTLVRTFMHIGLQGYNRRPHEGGKVVFTALPVLASTKALRASGRQYVRLRRGVRWVRLVIDAAGYTRKQLQIKPCTWRVTLSG